MMRVEDLKAGAQYAGAGSHPWHYRRIVEFRAIAGHRPGGGEVLYENIAEGRAICSVASFAKWAQREIKASEE